MVTLTRETRDALNSGRNAWLRSVSSRSVGLSSLVEELAHAELLKREKNDPAFAAFVRTQAQYYRGAPHDRGGTTTDPRRVFHEAAAGYVANAIAQWELAYEQLAILQRQVQAIQGGQVTAKELASLKGQLGRIVSGYNTKRNETVFGYSHEDVPLKWVNAGPQANTLRPINGGLKEWLDRELLEGKVGVEVQQDRVLGGMARDISQSFKELESARQGSQGSGR